MVSHLSADSEQQYRRASKEKPTENGQMDGPLVPVLSFVRGSDQDQFVKVCGLFNERVIHGWRAEREWGVLLRQALVWGEEHATYWLLAAWSHHRVPTEP
eukprot:3882968-Rhodomonas_salina.2